MVESPKTREKTISGYAVYIRLEYGYHNILIQHVIVYWVIYLSIYRLLSVNFHAFKKVDKGLYLRA